MIININYFFGLIKLREVYFENLPISGSDHNDVDIIRFVQCRGLQSEFDNNFFSTSICFSMLAVDIFNQFKKGLRYDIKKELEYISRNDLVFFEPNAVTNTVMKPLIGYLNTFQISRHLPRINKRKLMKLAHLNKLAISFIKKEDSILNYHVYLFDEPSGKVRLLYSFNVKSDFLSVNKVHTWFDIQKFQAMGMCEYDFGGISSFDQPNGIDRFKLSFGGSRDEYHTAYRACSLVGRIVMAVKGL
tara:strand:+ start:648 stop:1382 length:735 start_codon:yes stop_codon:yes gene_type:complete